MNRLRRAKPGEDGTDPIQVLVIDDSAVVRQVIREVLSADRGLAVATAANPIIAIDKMKRARPDVILLDLEMPRMDGLTFLRKIMAEEPTPVVICSGFAGRGTKLAMRALEEGAVEIITKPRLGVMDFLKESAVLLSDTVRAAAQARVPEKIRTPALSGPLVKYIPNQEQRSLPSNKIVAIGASTGGTEALRVLLRGMPTDCPGIVIVQHMPEGFTAAFAERLNQTCPVQVKEAADGDAVVRGRVLIARGNKHITVGRSGAGYVVELADGPLISRHRPSVDMLFRSVAAAAGAAGIGVILTGMGKDGAEGLSAMKQAGAATIAQDEATCVVFGMPKESIALGAVDEVVPLSRIADAIMSNASARTGPLRLPGLT